MKKPGKILEPKHCVDVNLFLLKWGAVFPFDNFSSSAWVNILYKCYTNFTIMLFFFMSTFMPLYVIVNDCTLEEAIEVISILVTQIRSGMKLMTFVLNRKKIQHLINAVYKNFYIRGKKFEADESRIVHEAIQNGRTVSIGYFSLVFSTTTSMLLRPLTVTPTDFDQEETLNSTAVPPRILPFKLWFPMWDATSSPKYEIEYVVQVLIATLEGWFVGATDSFCVTIMILVSCQFDLLCNSLKNLNKNVCLKSGIKTHQKRTLSYSEEANVFDKNSTLHVKAERNRKETRNHTNDSVCLSNWDDNTFQDMESDVVTGNQTPSTAKSYEQTEREVIEYVKECVRYHQSLLA